MSFQALNAALSGLRVAQQQLNVISNNVANVGTPGYTRKILPQSTQVIASTGDQVGVLANTMIRNVDLNLERELWTQVSAVSALDIKASYLSAIETFNGSPDSGLSLAAKITDLKNSFISLADAPDDGFLLQSTLDVAEEVAGKFNDLGALITQLRNDAQDEMVTSVERINDLLEQVAELNGQIKGAANVGRSSAAQEDLRDEAVKALADELEISFFVRGDGVLVVQTTTGVQLADERAETVFFDPGILGPSTAYSATSSSNVAGVYVGGDPLVVPVAVDVTQTGLGGRLGALIELRDDTLMQYQSQIDELAHKMALRFEAQGLRLFTNSSGTIPADTAPDPLAGPPTAVSYVGFASIIEVNAIFQNNISLLQQGTYTSDSVIPTGSNEVIRRVIEFTFGTTEYQEAAGTIDLNIAAPATDLQEWLGLYSQNRVVTGIDIGSFPEIDDGVPGSSTDLAESLQTYFPTYPADDQLQITFEEARTGLGPITITLDLSDADTNFPIGGPVGDALDQIIAEINSQIVLAGVPAGLAAQATRNANGQLVIESRGNVTIDGSSFAGSMGASALGALGLQEGTFVTEDPYFDVQIGNQDPVRITIEPGELTADLIDKLEWDSATQTGVFGLHVDFDALSGQLTLRPGIDDTNGGPVFGGDMRIIGGPVDTNTPVNPVLAALPGAVGTVSAIFGSFTVDAGPPPSVLESSPVADVLYQSETTNGSGTFVGFRKEFLGPGASVTSGILTASTLEDYAQKAVNKQTQDLILAQTRAEDEGALRDLLQRQFLDESGVNIDEELSNLILVQTAYAAAARAVSAADELFAELLEAVR